MVSKSIGGTSGTTNQNRNPIRRNQNSNPRRSTNPFDSTSSRSSTSQRSRSPTSSRSSRSSINSRRNICQMCHLVMNVETQLPCGHRFHRNCIAEWCAASRELYRTCNCPVCNYQLDNNLVNQL